MSEKEQVVEQVENKEIIGCSFLKQWDIDTNCYCECLDALPKTITDYKQEYILNQANLNTRFMALCLGSLSIAAISAKIRPSFVKVTRNLIISYVVGGLFITPEVFNPYLMYRFKE